MYDYIRGRIAEIEDQSIVLEAGGIGFRIGVPRSVSTRLPDMGSEAMVYITVVTRETGQTLYGFRSKTQRELFEMLTSLNGVGPKSALNLMSHMSIAQLQEAVTLGDAKAFKKIPGVGPKIAERLLVELRDRIGDLAPEGDEGPQGRLVHDALKALIQLGFAQSAAQKMLQEAATQQPGISDLPTLLSAALRRVAK